MRLYHAIFFATYLVGALAVIAAHVKKSGDSSSDNFPYLLSPRQGYKRLPEVPSAVGQSVQGAPGISTQSTTAALVEPVSNPKSLFRCVRKCNFLHNKAAYLLNHDGKNERELVYRYFQARKNRLRERNKAFALGITVVGWIIPYRNYRRYLRAEKALEKQLVTVIGQQDLEKIRKLKTNDDLNAYFQEKGWGLAKCPHACKKCDKAACTLERGDASQYTAYNGFPPPAPPHQFAHYGHNNVHNAHNDRPPTGYPSGSPFYGTPAGYSPGIHTGDNCGSSQCSGEKNGYFSHLCHTCAEGCCFGCGFACAQEMCTCCCECLCNMLLES